MICEMSKKMVIKQFEIKNAGKVDILLASLVLFVICCLICKCIRLFDPM